jgi:hypothetical protein
MTGKQYVKAIKSVGLSITASGPFFGYAERQGFRWQIDGPPPAVVMVLELMSALGWSAKDVDAALKRKR